MTGIYGGLWLENLVYQDEYFKFQIKFFELGLIQGIQLRVAHPSFTPGLSFSSLPGILSRLPKGMEIFIHFGAENAGVDFGESLDEHGFFRDYAIKTGESWINFNRDTLLWAAHIVANSGGRTRKDLPIGVVHPGYGMSEDDSNAFKKIIKTLQFIGAYEKIALENVPAIVDKKFNAPYWKTEVWKNNQFWGFGSTPDDMSRLLAELGSEWKCLIDFTHLIVTVNQAANFNHRGLENYRSLEKAISGFMALPHWPICHFSGIPPRDCLVDNHDFIKVKPPEVLREAIRQMEIVCLEIPFQPDKSKETIKDIETFNELYLR